MYFLVNASPPKPLDVAASNFADALVRSKVGICDGVPSTEVWLTFINVAFLYMQQTYFHLIMSLHLLSSPKNSKTYMKS